jgi:hypothetical protein
MKVCTKCKLEKPLVEFNKLSTSRDKLQYHCKKCKNDYQKVSPNRKAIVIKYREENKDICNARSIKSQKKKRGYYTSKAYEWQSKNRDLVNSRRRKRYSENRSSEIERVRRRQGRIKGSILTPAYQAEVDGMYVFCSIFKGFEVDHIIPLNGKVVSGLHVPTNLQVLPMSENRRKGNKYPLHSM